MPRPRPPMKNINKKVRPTEIHGKCTFNVILFTLAYSFLDGYIIIICLCEWLLTEFYQTTQSFPIESAYTLIYFNSSIQQKKIKQHNYKHLCKLASTV